MHFDVLEYCPMLNFEIMHRNADRTARLLKLLANPQRLRVLCLLADGEYSVSELNERIGLSQPALSQHLSKLRDNGLVKTRRESQTIYYRLNSEPVRRLIASLQGIYSAR
jgi:DNA-binding transcriptional ArsR family regulator